VSADAVFSTRPLACDLGEELAQWEEKIWADLFIATQGVNWSPGNLRESVKWPGASRSVIGPAAARFHEVFDVVTPASTARRYEALLEGRRIHLVPISVQVFNGRRLALARRKP
jgi:hypothetical protein